MKFNTKIRYGLRTMIELAMDRDDKGLLQKDIAKKQEISEKYLDHIISALKIAGLIINSKGKKSGYKLTKNPSEITVYDIFQAFEADYFLNDCLKNTDICSRTNACAAQIFWSEFNTTIVDYLKTVTLSKLADQQVKINTKEKEMYYI